ncbi:MAG: hypothetical protein IPM29_20690 [Planctomycetes bacterium]|nr:hypothetical protein [Planctomycetota bacterium]
MTTVPPDDRDSTAARDPGRHETDPPLSEREALMMAYVDDELLGTDRSRFEQWMRDDSALAAEVADYRVLLDLSRSSGQLEPTDHELRRFWARFYNRTEWRVGWALLGAGCLVLFGCAVYGLCALLSLPWLVKAAILAILAGGGLLLASTVRQRLRTRALDRYRGVLR